jgi:glycerol uptake facilitator-like aquaporin
MIITARKTDLFWHKGPFKHSSIKLISPLLDGGREEYLMANITISKRMAAEFLGTFWLVLGGCGSAVLAAAFPDLGIGFMGVALPFGLTVLTMAYAIGHISGCHLNPAVSIGLWAGGRFPGRDLGPYIIAQVVGGIAGAAVLFIIASGKAVDLRLNQRLPESRLQSSS